MLCNMYRMFEDANLYYPLPVGMVCLLLSVRTVHHSTSLTSIERVFSAGAPASVSAAEQFGTVESEV